MPEVTGKDNATYFALAKTFSTLKEAEAYCEKKNEARARFQGNNVSYVVAGRYKITYTPHHEIDDA